MSEEFTDHSQNVAHRLFVGNGYAQRRLARLFVGMHQRIDELLRLLCLLQGLCQSVEEADTLTLFSKGVPERMTE